MNTTSHVHGVLLLVVLFLWSGCAHDPSEPLPSEPTAMERIMNQRAKIAELNGDPHAQRARAELGRAEAFLRRAELALDSESDLVPLLLEATDAQLARVQTLYARHRAEAQLARASEDFAAEWEASGQGDEDGDDEGGETP